MSAISMITVVTGSGETFRMRKNYYDEFKESIEKKVHFDEDILEDFLYYLYDTFEEIELEITKIKYLLRAAELVDVIPIGDIMELKHFELARLLRCNKERISYIYDNISNGQSEQSDNL